MKRVADFVARVRAIAREYQFEPVYDEAQFKKTVEKAIDDQLRRWIADGELLVDPGHELKIEVSFGERHGPTAIDVKVIEKVVEKVSAPAKPHDP